jgi:hypothetical protein
MDRIYDTSGVEVEVLIGKYYKFTLFNDGNPYLYIYGKISNFEFTPMHQRNFDRSHGRIIISEAKLNQANINNPRARILRNFSVHFYAQGNDRNPRIERISSNEYSQIDPITPPTHNMDGGKRKKRRSTRRKSRVSKHTKRVHTKRR